MTLNYNHALFRSLRQPMAESLERIVAETQAVCEGDSDGAKMLSMTEANALSGSLAMIGCGALERLSRTLVESLEHIQDAPAYGWDETQTKVAARAACALSQAMIPLIGRMAERETIFPVRLYPLWKEVILAMNLSLPPPEELFEPAPDLEDMTFNRLDQAHLARLVQAANVRLESARHLVLEAADQDSFRTGLEQAFDVFQWAFNLFHRRGFQPYWMVLTARLALAQLELNESFDHPEAIQELLRDASIELKRFSTDASKVSVGRVNTAIAPMLARWPAHWQHPAMVQLRDVFALEAFWQALDDISVDPNNPPPGQRFDRKREEISKDLGQVRASWEKWLEHTAPVTDLQRHLARFMLQAGVFPQAEASSLIQNLDEVIQWCSQRPEENPDEEVVDEVSGSILALEDALDPRQQGQSELAEQLRLQRLRLEALMVPGRPDLARLPVIRWGNARRRRETQEARRQSLLQVVADLTTVEQRIDEVLREEIDPKDVRGVLSDLVGRLEVGAAAMEMLKLPLHARIQRAFLERLDVIGVRPSLLEDPIESQHISTVLPALINAVSAAADGQEDTEDALIGVAESFLNEPIQGRTDGAELPVFESASGIESEIQSENDLSTSEDLTPVVAMEAPSDQEDENHSEASLDSASENDSTVEVGVEAAQLLSAEDVEAALPPASEDNPMPVSDRAHQSTPEEEEEGESPDLMALPSSNVGQALASADGYMETIDPEEVDLTEIYFAEVTENLEEVRKAREVLRENPAAPEILENVRRAFHSIKGSGRLVHLNGLGELGFWGETYMRGIESRQEPFNDRHDQRLALLSQTLVMAIEELEDTKEADLRGQTLWRMLNEKDAPDQARASATVLSASTDQEDEADKGVEASPVEDEGEVLSHTEVLDHLYDEAESEIDPASSVPIDYDPVPVEPIVPPISSHEKEWTVPEADADTHTHQELPTESRPGLAIDQVSSWEVFRSDPESAAALTSEWKQRREQLQEVMTTGDAEVLSLVAHTLRTIALTFEWRDWAKEFGEVERSATQLSDYPDHVRAWAVRWVAVIDQALAGQVPEWSGDEVDEGPSGEVSSEAPSAALALPDEDREGNQPAVTDEAANEVAVPELAREAAEANAGSEPVVGFVEGSEQLETPAETLPAAPHDGVETALPLPVALESVLETTAKFSDALSDAPIASDSDAVWTEIFAAYGVLMEGGRRLGKALEALAQRQDDK